MRIMTATVISLAVCFAFPAAAAEKPGKSQVSRSWEECHDQAVKHGMHRTHRGYDEFVKDCQAGKTSQHPVSAKVSR